MHRHLYHHVSNGITYVVIHQKCQRKSDENTKNASRFANTKVYSLLHFFVVGGKERESVWKLSRPRYQDKEKQNVMRERERERARESRPWIIFHAFIIVLTVLVCWFRLHSFTPDVRSLFGAQAKMGAATFGCFYIVVSVVQLNAFTS